MHPSPKSIEQLAGMGVAVTAPGTSHDCVSRFFAPKIGVAEDPVTGSVHCMIGPYWGGHLGKSSISAYQASERGGEMLLELKGGPCAHPRQGRALLKGRAQPVAPAPRASQPLLPSTARVRENSICMIALHSAEWRISK